MTELDELLREAMRARTKDLTLRPSAARDAMAAAIRVRRTRAVLGTTGAAAATSALVVGVLNLGGNGGASGARIDTAPSPTSGAPSPSSTSAPSTASAPSTPVPSATSTLCPSPGEGQDPAVASTPLNPPAALEAVTLPDPAPGFPARSYPDTVHAAIQGGYRDASTSIDFWARMFGVTRACPPSATSGTDTIPAAGITVIMADVVDKYLPRDLYPPDTAVGTRTVQGEPAQARKGPNGLVLIFRKGRFTVAIFGIGGATADDLVTLGDSLRGLS